MQATKCGPPASGAAGPVPARAWGSPGSRGGDPAPAPRGLGSVGVHQGCEVGTDLVGLGSAEVGVKGHGLLVVLVGPGTVADGVVGVAEAGVGAGHLVPAANFGGEGEGGGVMTE